MNVAPGVWNKHKLESFLNGTGGGICCGPLLDFNENPWRNMIWYASASTWNNCSTTSPWIWHCRLTDLPLLHKQTMALTSNLKSITKRWPGKGVVCSRSIQVALRIAGIQRNSYSTQIPWMSYLFVPAEFPPDSWPSDISGCPLFCPIDHSTSLWGPQARSDRYRKLAYNFNNWDLEHISYIYIHIICYIWYIAIIYIEILFII